MVPINDIRGVESMGYAKGEKILRCKLAAVYRLMDLYGWTQNIYNHITVSSHFCCLIESLKATCKEKLQSSLSVDLVCLLIVGMKSESFNR